MDSNSNTQPAMTICAPSTSPPISEINPSESSNQSSSKYSDFTKSCQEQNNSINDKNQMTQSPIEYTAGSNFPQESDACVALFSQWTVKNQNAFVEELLANMCHHQHKRIESCLQPMLKINFISNLRIRHLEHVAESILSYLDNDSLLSAELVCVDWSRAIVHGMLWKKLMEDKVRHDALWRDLAERKRWMQYLDISEPGIVHPSAEFYKDMYMKCMNAIDIIECNWRLGKHKLRRIDCRSNNGQGVYCLQYDQTKILFGSRDHTIQILDQTTLQCTQILTGHTGSVLCLQYDERILITGSSDTTVRVWDIVTGAMINTLIHHSDSVLHLKFGNGMMVTGSKDLSIAVWKLNNPTDITVRRILVGHRAAVNVVDFDKRYIVSAGGDKTIKVWDTVSCALVRNLIGHERAVTCLQYKNRIVISGSGDTSIRLWDIESGTCIRVLHGHGKLVRCLRFDSKRIVSGDYDGTIKVWNLAAVMNPKAPTSSLCFGTLIAHTERIFKIQFDELQIVSGALDGQILIWDFFHCSSIFGRQDIFN